MEQDERTTPRPRGTFYGPVRPRQLDDEQTAPGADQVKDPKKVRRELRLGAIGFILLAVAVLVFAFSRHFSAAIEGGAEPGQTGVIVGLWVSPIMAALGLIMSLALWFDLPPRTLRSSSPSWFGAVILFLLIGGDMLGRIGFTIEVPPSFWKALAFFGLLVYLLLAALSVSGLPWRGKPLVVVALLLGAATWTPVALVAVGAIAIDGVIERPLLFTACGAMVVAFIGLAIGGFRTASLANDQDLR